MSLIAFKGMRLDEVQRQGVDGEERPGYWNTSELRILADMLWEIK